MANKKRTPSKKHQRPAQAKGTAVGPPTSATTAANTPGDGAPAQDSSARPRRATRPAGHGASVPPDIERLEPVALIVCTGRNFPGALGDTYSEVCATLAVPVTSGYALIQTQDAAGACWTVISTDVEGVTSVLAIESMGVSCGYVVDPATVVTVRAGWVLESTVGLADRPVPHPPQGPLGPGAVPEAGRAWAPAGRRELADHIAEELSEPPGFSQADYIQTMYGDSDPEPDLPRLVDLLRVRADLSQPLIEEALISAWSLTTETRARGVIRAVMAGRHARMVRATGPTWSLLACPGDVGPAVLLLDEAPDAVIDLADADRLDDLLEALVQVADGS